MLQYNPTVTGSLQVSGDITGTVNGINITGLSQSVSTQLINVQASTGSSDAKFETLSGVTSSALTRLTNIETKSASVDISISNINSYTSSNDTKFTTLGTYTGSLDTKNTILADVTSSLISKTGSYATTGSNQFYGTQVFSGSVYIANDLIVQGSSSIQYISASSVSIGTNIVQLNTANPSVRFAGLTIIDSGSVGGSGSFLYDSLQDEFIFVHRGNGTNVTSSHFVLGPETYDSLGNETYLTCNILTKGTGKEHLVDSCIFDNGTTTCIKNNLIGTGTITGTTIYGSTAVCSPVGKFTSCIDAGSGTFSGNVVIGGSSPVYLKFNVQETAANRVAILYRGTQGGDASMITAFGTPYLSIGGQENLVNSIQTIGFGFTNGTTYTQPAEIGFQTTSTSGYTCGDLVFATRGATTNTVPTERMRITSAGNVGIGTCTPVGKLDVTLVNTRRFIVTYDDSIITIKGASDTGGGENLRMIGDNLIFNTNSVGSGTERMRITSTGIACFACQICAPRINISNTSTVLLVQGTATNGEASINLSGKNSSGTVRDAVLKYDNTDVIRLGTPSNIGMQFETNDVARFRLTSTGIACFACQVCSPQFTGGLVCAVGGLNVRGASTTWSTFNLFPDNPGGAGDQCKTVLAGSIVGCTGFGPQLRFSGASGGFIDIGQDCTAAFVVETSDTPRLRVHQCGAVQISGVAHKSYLLSDTLQTPVQILQLDNNSMYEIEYSAMHYEKGSSTNGWWYVKWHGYDGSGGGGQGGGCNFYVQVIQCSGTAESQVVPSIFGCVQTGKAYICYGNGYMSFRQLNVRRLIDDGGNNSAFL
jgi:hypothetical protein